MSDRKQDAIQLLVEIRDELISQRVERNKDRESMDRMTARMGGLLKIHGDKMRELRREPLLPLVGTVFNGDNHVDGILRSDVTEALEDSWRCPACTFQGGLEGFRSHDCGAEA